MLGTQTRKPKKNYHHLSHRIYSCLYHVVFCPKYRYKVLVSPVKERLETLLLEAQQRYDFFLMECQVLPDHVHLLLDINPKYSVLSVIAKIKGWTSFVLRKEFSNLRSLPSLWTRSEFISSVGAVTLEVVKKYIEGQRI
jgi:putative transposase